MCQNEQTTLDAHEPALKRSDAPGSLTMPLVVSAVALVLLLTLTTAARASDHLDSPATVANPQADISDVYAWMSRDARRLNLVMTVLGHSFSDKIEYVLHVDSGHVFGHTTASTSITCHFASSESVACDLGKADSVSGNPTNTAGIEGRNHRFRVYAALRDDPFYNNVKGLLAAYEVGRSAIDGGARIDAAGCPHLDEATAKAILYQMGHTDGGQAQNLLRNWTVSAIVISVDIGAVRQGGKLLAVWGTTSLAGKQLDRMARPFVTNTLLGIAPFSTDDASGVLRQKYNEAPSPDEAHFVGDLRKSLAFQDSLDGQCGNQVLAEAKETPLRYEVLAKAFSDDRLWVNSDARVCTQFFAVELAALAGRKTLTHDCGGRSPSYDTSNVWRSLLIAGTGDTITDGLDQDEHLPSATSFPFLVPPDPNGVDH
jgi:hypothetical protein